MYTFPSLEPACCSLSSFNCCFFTCIQVSQEAGKMVWYSHLSKIIFSLTLWGGWWALNVLLMEQHTVGTVPGGEFDWGGTPVSGKAGVLRWAQGGQKPPVEQKDKSSLDLDFQYVIVKTSSYSGLLASTNLFFFQIHVLFFRFSYFWTHTTHNLWPLTSFTQHNVSEIHQ